MSLNITAFSSACKIAQRRKKCKLNMFQGETEGSVLAGSHLRIITGEKLCPGFQQHPFCSVMGPDLPLALSSFKATVTYPSAVCLSLCCLTKKQFHCIFFLEYICFLLPPATHCLLLCEHVATREKLIQILLLDGDYPKPVVS